MSEIKAGDTIAVQRFSGVTLRGTVESVGEWIRSCAGTPMRWVAFTDAKGTRLTVADTPFNDSQITVLS